MTVVPFRSPPTLPRRRIVTMTCPCCRKRTRLIGVHQWLYGWRDTCLRCGRTWTDGQWTELPFIRGARAQSIAEAKRRWRATPGAVVRQTVGGMA